MATVTPDLIWKYVVVYLCCASSYSLLIDLLCDLCEWFWACLALWANFFLGLMCDFRCVSHFNTHIEPDRS